MKKVLLTVLIQISGFLIAQVGIGKSNPVQTLDINGNMKVSENLYLENPGVYIGQAANSYLLVKDNSNQTIKRYVPETSAYSAISNASYAFKSVSFSGISNYDTGIPSSVYYLTLTGYILRGSGDTSNIYITGDINNIPLYSARAFVENGTWRIKFLPNNGRLFTVPEDITPKNMEITINIVVYRRDMLTTINSQINYDMKANTSGTGTAPVPSKM